MSKPTKSQWTFGGLIIFLSLSLLAVEGRAESWRLIWSDEFNGPVGTGIDTNKWTAEKGGNGWGNNEWEFYTASPSNAALDGHGCLDIVALKLPAHTFDASYGEGEYSSARLVTGKKFLVKYGRIEARIRIPAGRGGHHGKRRQEAGHGLGLTARAGLFRPQQPEHCVSFEKQGALRRQFSCFRRRMGGK
jgi:hypothetical protein